MTEQVVAEIRKNSREVIRITLQEFKGVPLCSVRVWFEAEDGTMRPGRDGLNFRQELLADITEGMLAAVEALSGRPVAEPPPSRRTLNS